jgi:hypothetical protein
MSKVQKIKTHIKENKKTYISCTVCFVVGAATSALIIGSQNAAIVDSFKLQINSPTTNNIMQTVLERRGHPGKVIRCLELDKKWSSIRHAAKELEVNRQDLSEHLRGLKESIGGMHFEYLGDAV